ncbi:Akinase anchor protein 17Alike, partial [Caligus rogercresseyi]
MSVIQSCHDKKDILDFFKPGGLYLKPISRLNLKKSGSKISNWEFIRFEAEIDNFGSMDQVLKSLDMKTIKLSGFKEVLKVRAAEAKTSFPNNKHMNELKPGERPDTLHISNLPNKWFINYHDRSGISRDKPSEYVLRKVFSAFGEVRVVDIPLLDPY